MTEGQEQLSSNYKIIMEENEPNKQNVHTSSNVCNLQ